VADRNDGFVWLDEPRQHCRLQDEAPAATAEETPHTALPERRTEERMAPLVGFLYKRYFRVQTRGLEHVPTAGGCLLMCNHAGGPLPFDGMMLRAALAHDHPTGRCMRWLNESFIDELPVVGTASERLGGIRSKLSEAERRLADGQAVAVFPEGAPGISKPLHLRHRLASFGQGDHLKMALRTRTPVIPCAIVGAEDIASVVYRLRHLFAGLGLPQAPLGPATSRLGALGLLPAPTRWRLQFGEPIDLGQYAPEDAHDASLMTQLSQRVQADMQGMLDELVATRRSVWFG
jgi:1-acyl-sn-glycerol-3-phosphate acyltransferase